MPDIILNDTRGGRNGIDATTLIANNQLEEAYNADWGESALGTKRRGSQALLTSVDLSAGIASIHRHVPDGDETQAELWVVRVDGHVFRLTTAGWSDVTPADAITSSMYDVAFCSFNKKLFVAFQSAVARLHVWDPDDAAIRRVGLRAFAAAPTVANSGSGSYAATLRYYRCRSLHYVGGVIKRRSEPSAVRSFTPDGSHLSAVVTRPTAIAEGETHWEVEVATAAEGPWYVLAGVAAVTIAGPIAIGTTTYSDTTAVGGYVDLTTSEDSGQYTLPPSVRYIKTDGNHLLMGGNYTAGGLTSRIWNTPALGSSDHGDDERIILTDSIKGYVNLNEKDGGAITGISDPIQGSIWVGKYRQIWKLSPTTDPASIYLPRKISSSVGVIHFKAMVSAEDYRGNPILAFLSTKGPYRVGSNGLEAIGRDVDDIWFGRNNQAPVNLNATTIVAHGVYHDDRHQIWFYVARDTDNSPRTKLMVDVRRNIVVDAYGIRGGWAVHEGVSCQAACSTLFAATIGAAMSLNLKPYIGYLPV